jgi:uncharacterized protein (UPF0254 family)
MYCRIITQDPFVNIAYHGHAAQWLTHDQIRARNTTGSVKVVTARHIIAVGGLDSIVRLLIPDPVPSRNFAAHTSY